MSKLKQLLQEKCPNGVEYKTLGELEDSGFLTLGRGAILSKKYMQKNKGNYPVFSAAQTNNGIIGYCNTFMFDDIRLTWSIDGGGKFFYRDDEKYSVTNVCGWLKVNDESKVNVKYLYYALTHEWTSKIYNYMHKAHPSVIREEYILPVPPIEVQTEIANILDQFTAYEAALRKELDLRKKQYAYYREKFLTFEDGVEYKTLGELCISLPKGTLKTTELQEGGQFPVVNSGKDFYGFYSKCNNDGNAFTIASRGNAGFIKYIDTPFWAGGLCYPYRSKCEDSIITKFVYYYLKSKELDIMEDLVLKGAIPAINKADVDNILIPVPEIEVQAEIVHKLNCFESLCKDLATEIELFHKQYEYYRDKLLTF